MTALILMLMWLPQVLSAGGELPRPLHLNLASDHFNTMLTWEPGPGTPPGVHYRVQVITEKGTFWKSVAGCERVRHPLVCNLTQAFSDHSQVYLTRVIALLGAQASEAVLDRRFQPMRDTHLDLPLLTVTPCGKNICVDLQPPMEHLRAAYESLRYKLRFRADGAGGEKDANFLNRAILDNLTPGRQYCVSVRFADSLVPRQSNYSRPVCAVTPSNFSADALVAGLLCVLVMFGVVVLAWLVGLGFICPIRKPLPHVLTSFHHLDGVLVASPSRASLSSHLNLDPTAPSAGGRRSSRTPSDGSEEETETETTGGSSGGGAYTLRAGANLLSSSTSSSSSLPAPLSSACGPAPSVSSDQQTPPDSAGLHPEAPTAPPVSTDSPETTENKEEEEEEEEEVVEEGDGQDVNLLTLTFGRYEEDEEDDEEEEEESSSALQVNRNKPLMDIDKVAIETVSCSVEEEEEEDDSGYMQRPCTRDML